mmetsp:Transcript_27876/g.64952  ORF Transcript_27876/g.64952 Transcript_27876/m.64952 type:complete len:340 (-) Transcript_27876:40-1059(-)
MAADKTRPRVSPAAVVSRDTGAGARKANGNTKGRGGGDHTECQGVDADYKGSAVRSVWTLLNAVGWVPIIGSVALSCALLIPFIGLARAQRMVWRIATVYFRLVLWATGISYTVIGLENLDPDRNYFFVCNHESIYDIPIAFAALPFWLIAVAKTVIAYFPFFGWAVALGGTIFITRSNHKRAVQSLDAGRRSLQEKPRSVLLFPEGTRSDDGVVRPFKKGGLVLALQAGMDCVPVAVCGTRRIIGREVDKFEPIVACRVKVIIGKPIPTKSMSFEDRDSLAEKLHTDVVRMKTMWEDGVCNLRDVSEPETFANCFRAMPPSDKKWYGRKFGLFEKMFG